MGGALSFCSPGVAQSVGDFLSDGRWKQSVVLSSSSSQELILDVKHTVTEASLGALLPGFKAGERLTLEQLEASSELETLGARFREGTKNRWPLSYRFQVSRRSWRVVARTEDGGCHPCVLQCAILPQERTLENARLDLADATDAVAYASRFNLHQQKEAEGEATPSVKVAVPAVCSVAETCFPAMIPRGTACLLFPYPEGAEVHKFVFDGREDFLELAHSFFHYAAFSSNGKQFVCDLQGAQLDNGDLLLIDPCVLRSDLPSVGAVVGAAAGAAGAAVAGGGGEVRLKGPNAALFDDLHPRCAQLCRTFDPQRKTAKRSVGLCGGACGIGG